MKIIQLNIWGGKLGRQVIQFLNSEKPDFVCMQEVNDLKGRSGYKFFATLDEIKNEAGFSHAFMSPSYSSRYMERELEYGNAILSNFSFASTEIIFTRGEYTHHFDVEINDGNIRTLQIGKVEIDGRPLHILNHHGHHVPDSKAGNDETMRQMGIIADTLEKLDGPIILCGDFNLAPESKSIGLINEKLTNLSVMNKLKSTYSRFGAVSEVCDYIFVNGGVKVRSFKMSDELVTDHRPLILEFDLAD